MDDSDLTVPAHLRTVLGAAAEQEFEAVSDGHWPDDADARAAHRDAVRAAARLLDNWTAGGPTAQEVMRLALRAISEQQPRDFVGQWPTTLEAVDELIARATLTRELIQYRDALGGGGDDGAEGGA